MFVLADGINSTAAAIVGGALGVIIVLVLIGAFVIGAWRKEREPAPDLDPHSPERELWSTPPSTPGSHPHGDPHEHPQAHAYEYAEEPKEEEFKGEYRPGRRRYLVGHHG